jgi:hypothetical protein
MVNRRRCHLVIWRTPKLCVTFYVYYDGGKLYFYLLLEVLFVIVIIVALYIIGFMLFSE